MQTEETGRPLNSYEQKQADRKARLEAASAAHAQASESTYAQARRMADVIPFGQPIHIGHHSEKSDRNYRARIGNKFEQAFNETKRAEELAEKAASVGTGGISSDDPDAIEKLVEKLQKMEADQDHMKKANAFIKKGNRAGVESLGFSATAAATLFEKDCMGCIGFPSYRLTNNNANIKRLKERIAQLEQAARSQDVEIVVNGYTYNEDTTENRAMFSFDTRQPAEITAQLKSRGFKWSPTRSAWVRMLTNNARWASKEIMRVLDAS